MKKKYYNKNILIELRKKLNLTQYDIARSIGKSQECISKIETGRTRLSEDILYKIYDAYNISPDSFSEDNGLIFLNSNSYENYLQVNYNLTPHSASIFSDYLKTYTSLTKEAQKHADETLQAITNILSNGN